MFESLLGSPSPPSPPELESGSCFEALQKALGDLSALSGISFRALPKIPRAHDRTEAQNRRKPPNPPLLVVPEASCQAEVANLQVAVFVHLAPNFSPGGGGGEGERGRGEEGERGRGGEGGGGGEGRGGEGVTLEGGGSHLGGAGGKGKVSPGSWCELEPKKN